MKKIVLLVFTGLILVAIGIIKYINKVNEYPKKIVCKSIEEYDIFIKNGGKLVCKKQPDDSKSIIIDKNYLGNRNFSDIAELSPQSIKMIGGYCMLIFKKIIQN